MKKMNILRMIILMAALCGLGGNRGLFARQQADPRYDAGLNLPFNAKAGDVNPQTGNITIGAVDLKLPGRAGMNFIFSRSWSLNRSNVFAMGENSSFGQNVLTSDTIEQYNHLGVGWSSNLPYIFDDNSSVTPAKYLAFGGGMYALNTVTLTVYDDDASNIIDYDLLDMRVYSVGGDPDLTIQYGDFPGGTLPVGSDDQATDQSLYVLIIKNNSRYYFRPDGKIMMHQDPTGLNQIWYFYEEYQDENEADDTRLVVAVDSIGREIHFNYTPEDNLSSIEWDVVVGRKNPDGTRSYDPSSPETRQVTYSYGNAESSYSRVGAFASQVIEKKTPYALLAATDPQGNVTRYEYKEETAGFSYNSDYFSGENVYLLLTTIINNYTAEGYKSKQSFEYDPPAQGMHSRSFFQGFMEYFKLSRQYNIDRHGRIMQNTTYLYFDPGARGNWNEYETVIQQGNLTTTYIYTLSESPKFNHVLAHLITESSDGFLEKKNFAYNSDRTRALVEVSRNGHWVYSEHFQYDSGSKGNLKRHEARNGLVTTFQYDPVYSIPIEEVKSLHAGGQQVEYKTTRTINGLGQVVVKYIYLDRNGTIEAVPAARYTYDIYGNVTEVTDAEDRVTHTVYDAACHAFPVKSWQDVTIAGWSGGGDVDANWLTSPDPGASGVVPIRKWSVFNTDGTVWMEVDNAGYAVEHYYDEIGNEIETVKPNADDDHSFAADSDFADFYTDYLVANSAAYFLTRTNNPGSRIVIDYQGDLVKTYLDIDKENGDVLVTGVQGDGLGNVEEEITCDPVSGDAVKTMTYDDLGRMIALTDPDADPSSTDVTIHGTRVQKHDKTWIVKYDDLGRKKRIIYPVTVPGTVHYKEITYDDLVNTVTTTDPEVRTIVETHDWNGNLVELEVRGDGSTPLSDRQVYHYRYDELNRKISFTDPEGIETKYAYDERNLLIRQNYGASGSDFMTYDNLGRLEKKTDRKAQVLFFTYDELGRNTRVDHYLADGNNNGTNDFTEGLLDHSVSTVYDSRGNAVRIENENLIEHYIYDYANQVVNLDRRLTDQSLREDLAAGLWGGSESGQVFSFTYSHNDMGLITAMGYPDGATHTFTYDGTLGQLVSINDGTEDFISRIDYNRAGVVKQINYFNNTYQTWEFDNRKRISQIGIHGPTDDITTLNYTLNGSGDILAINDNEYAYDGFDRIVSAETLIPGNKDVRKLVAASFGTQLNADPVEIQGVVRTYNSDADLNDDGRINGADHAEALLTDLNAIYDLESYTYDRNGNRTHLTRNGAEYRYTYGVRNRLEKIERKKAGEADFSDYALYIYDANGNTTSRTIFSDSGTTVVDFEYDTMNRLTRSTQGSEVTEYFYDNAGNRLIKKDATSTALYLRHGQIAVAMDIEVNIDQTSEKGKRNRYVLSGDLLAGRITTVVAADNSETETKHCYHLDHLNSTKAVTDYQGTLEVIYEYRAFGEQLKRLDAAGQETADEAGYSYGGKELDEATNLYYFNARYYDATIGRFINVDPVQDGSNWYIYCRNNPLSMVDPTGLFGGQPPDIVAIQDKSIQIAADKIRRMMYEPLLRYQSPDAKIKFNYYDKGTAQEMLFLEMSARLPQRPEFEATVRFSLQYSAPNRRQVQNIIDSAWAYAVDIVKDLRIKDPGKDNDYNMLGVSKVFGAIIEEAQIGSMKFYQGEMKKALAEFYHDLNNSAVLFEENERKKNNPLYPIINFFENLFNGGTNVRKEMAEHTGKMITGDDD